MHTILWEYPAFHSVEYFTLLEESGSFVLAGKVNLSLENQPTHVTYRIECDPMWQTRRVTIQQQHAGQSKQLVLSVDAQQNWFSSDAPLPFATGFYDVDLAISPSTNTLPIRRLGLQVGQTQPIDAVWVRFPTLAVQPLHQNYTHLDASHYRYENPGSGFTATLEVDQAGLVVDYGDIWRRVR